MGVARRIALGLDKLFNATILAISANKTSCDGKPELGEIRSDVVGAHMLAFALDLATAITIRRDRR